MANENRRKYLPGNHWRTEAEMVKLFEDIPEAVENTVNIAKRCNYLSYKMEPLLPIFICPEGKTQDEFITEEAYKGLNERMKIQVYHDGMSTEERAETDRHYYERLDYELSVIKKWGFRAIFLSCQTSFAGLKLMVCRLARAVVPVPVPLWRGR